MSCAPETKICSNPDCPKEQPLSIEQFSIRSESGKLRDQCKDCVSIRRQQHYQNNKEDLKFKQKNFYEENKEEILERAVIWRDDNREILRSRQRIYYKENKEEIRRKDKIYRDKNREIINLKQKQYRKENKEHLNSLQKTWREKNKDKLDSQRKIWVENNKEDLRLKQNKWQKEKRQNDVAFKLRHDISISVNKAIKKEGGKKRGSAWSFLPFTPQELKEHIERLFESWMTWDNKGIYNSKTWDDNDPTTWTWQLDHIRPQSFFRFTTMDCQEFKECWALSNLRPYSAKQNLLDGARRF